MTYLPILLLFLHWLADFVGQTDWMALNKGKSWLALTIHVLTYSAILLLCLLPLVWIKSFRPVLLVVGMNALAHFATDAVTSRVSGYFSRTNRTKFFWWTIGFDQFLHAATLLCLADLFLL